MLNEMEESFLRGFFGLMGCVFLGGLFVEFYLFYSFYFIGGIKAGNVMFSGK